MHKALTLAAAALLAGSASLQAQHRPLPIRRFAPPADPRFSKAMARLSSLGSTAGTTAAKTTGTAQRLSSMSNWYAFSGPTVQPADSTTFRYGGTRTSSFDKTYLEYSTGYSYDAFGLDGSVDYDTSTYYDLSGGGLSERSVKLHNAAGKVTRYQNGNEQLDEYSYDAQGRPTLQISKEYDPQTSTWINYGKTGYRHDAQGKLLSDTTYEWDPATSSWEPSDLSVYAYNSTGKPSQATLYSWGGSSFDLDGRASVSYTAAGLQSVLKFETWTGSSYVLSYKDSFAYGAGNALAYHLSRSTSSAYNDYEEIRHLNASNLPDSIYVKVLNDPNVPSFYVSHIRLTWNSFGNPEMLRTREESPNLPERMQRYYYASFQTSQGLASAPVRKSLSVFPNPAAGVLTVRPDFNGAFHLNLVNAAGQTVLSSSGTAAAGQAIPLPLDNLTPGSYWLQLQNGDGVNYSAAFQKK